MPAPADTAPSAFPGVAIGQRDLSAAFALRAGEQSTRERFKCFDGSGVVLDADTGAAVLRVSPPISLVDRHVIVQVPEL